MASTATLSVGVILSVAWSVSPSRPAPGPRGGLPGGVDRKQLEAELARVERMEHDAFERATVRGWADQEALRPLNDLRHELRNAKPGTNAEAELLRAVPGRFTEIQNAFLERLRLQPAGQVSFYPEGVARVVTPFRDRHVEVFADVNVPTALVIGVMAIPAGGGKLVVSPVEAGGVRIEGQEAQLSAQFLHNVVLPVLATGKPGRRRVRLELACGGRSAFVPVTLDVRPSGTLSGTVTDADGHELWAKLFVEDADGKLYVVPGEKNYRTQSWYAPWQPRYSYVGGKFSMLLPVGTYRVTAMRGCGWRDSVATVKIEATKTAECRIELKRLHALEADGWLCADMHVHYSGGPTLAQLRGEDVNVVANTLYSSAKSVPLPSYPGRSDAAHRSTSNQEIEHWIFGNVFYFNIPRTVTDPPGGKPESAPMFHYDEQARAMGGLTMRWLRARPFSPNWHGQAQPELAVDAALGLVDAWGVLENSMQNLLDTPARKWTGDGWGGRLYENTYKTWYALANCGLRISAYGGTSYGRLSRLGFNRVYAKVSGKLTNASWATALKRGDGFVTNGPLLWLRAGPADGTCDRLPGDGLALARPGKVKLAVEMASQHPVRLVEIVRNGKVLLRRRVTAADTPLLWEATVDVERPSWFAARCFGEHKPRYPHSAAHNQFAHTNMLFVTVGGKRPASPDDARRFIKEIDALIAYAPSLATEDLRKRALAAYGKAREHFAEMAEGASGAAGTK